MSASPEQVAAAGAAWVDHDAAAGEMAVRLRGGEVVWLCRCGVEFTERSGWTGHRWTAVADAVVAAGPDPANVAAEALREAADADDWDTALGRANVRVRLRARADRIEAGDQ